MTLTMILRIEMIKYIAHEYINGTAPNDKIPLRYIWDKISNRRTLSMDKTIQTMLSCLPSPLL